MKYFYSSFAVAFIGIVIAFYIGGFSAAYICVLLAILEVSLSFDNAVVNAKVLDEMEPVWQDRFIIFGIPVAVFGMRFLFPILIVAVATGLGFVETFELALHEPSHYQEVLEGSKDIIYSFGGGFLLMVFLDFLFEDKKDFWINIFEDNALVRKLSHVKFISPIVAFLVALFLYAITKNNDIAIASIAAILLHTAISMLDTFFAKGGVRSGIMGFIYLEILDASFSFDGVIGAFALSSNIFIILIGLGIGALFVRSLTLYLVHHKTLSSYIYLEHGAHYAILMLSLIMFYELFHEVSEIVTGTIGITFILLSFLSSVRYNKKIK